MLIPSILLPGAAIVPLSPFQLKALVFPRYPPSDYFREHRIASSFNARGTELEKTPRGLYRSLLYGLLAHSPQATGSKKLYSTYRRVSRRR